MLSEGWSSPLISDGPFKSANIMHGMFENERGEDKGNLRTSSLVELSFVLLSPSGGALFSS